MRPVLGEVATPAILVMIQDGSYRSVTEAVETDHCNIGEWEDV